MLEFAFAWCAEMFKKILIANRGEIAVRIVSACRELGVRSVAVYSDADRAALHVRLADEAYPIGPAPSSESYLVDRKNTGRCALRPLRCHSSWLRLPRRKSRAAARLPRRKIAFIGPSAKAMEQLGSKTAARRIANAAGAPTVPGTLDPITDIGELRPSRAKSDSPLF